MSPAETAARVYSRAEDRFRERARFFAVTGQQGLSADANWYAERAHRAARAEILNPPPSPTVRRVR